MPKVLVIGAGFGGLEVARQLGKAGVAVTIVDRYNHHLFQPLLYQVATAALSATDIAEPVRSILSGYPSVEVLLGTVVGIDADARRVHLATGDALPWDILVLASGARTHYFGHEDWKAHAPGLKSIDDARRVRSKLLLTFEEAERATDPAERRRLMTIVIIGGGPTGVEMAGSAAELARFTLSRDFRNIEPASAQILLIEAGPRLLPSFDKRLAAYAHRRLVKLGVDVRTGRVVDHIGAGVLGIAGERLPVGLVVWAAGVAASPLGESLGIPTDRLGRVSVESDLRVVGWPEVFALGDVALCLDAEGKPLPGLAQVAKQQGVHLGKALGNRFVRGAEVPPFVYRSRGNTAIVRRHAVGGASNA